MIELGYLLWFIGTAIMTVLVLTLGTLAAAGILTRRGRHPRGSVRRDTVDRTGLEEGTPARRHQDSAAA